MDREHEEQMINNFRSEMEEKIKEKEREQQEEKQEREKKEEEVEEAEVATKVMEVVTEEVVSEMESQEGQTEPALPKDESIKVFGSEPRTKLICKKPQVEVHATAVHHELLEPKVAHAQAHEISHSQAVSSNIFTSLNPIILVWQGNFLRTCSFQLPYYHFHYLPSDQVLLNI